MVCDRCLPGVAFSDIDEEEILAPLRALTLSLHRRMAHGKPVMIEKTGFDIFYLNEIEHIFAGHAKFICVRRNPLDVVLSLKDLCDHTGVYLEELRSFVSANPSPLAAFAEAWAERNEALDAFISRHPEDCVDYRYEDLLTEPVATLRRITDALALSALSASEIESTLQQQVRVGLGDWKIYQQTGFDKSQVERWKQSLSKGTLSRLVPILAEGMTRHGYDVPRLPKPRDTKTAVRQFKVMTSLKRSGMNSPK